MNFKKPRRALFIGHYSLQILEFSCDLEILLDFVVEIPWNTPLSIHDENNADIEMMNAEG